MTDHSSPVNAEPSQSELAACMRDCWGLITDGMAKEDFFAASAVAIQELLRIHAQSTPWQPIETAQNNGTEKILLWWKHAGASIGWWAHDEIWQERKWGHKALEYGWMSEGDACIPVNQKDCTHWMPLPAGPAFTSPKCGDGT